MDTKREEPVNQAWARGRALAVAIQGSVPTKAVGGATGMVGEPGPLVLVPADSHPFQETQSFLCPHHAPWCPHGTLGTDIKDPKLPYCMWRLLLHVLP